MYIYFIVFNWYNRTDKLTISGHKDCFQFWIIPYILQEASL